MLETGKKYEFTRETQKTVEHFIAKVTWIEDRGDFWYIGYEPEQTSICLFGALKVKKHGKFKSINYSFKAV